MSSIDPRIDAYIEKAADFAKPILTHIRQVVHEACPEVVETMKWSMPFFDYKGEMLCNMASFKAHCSLGFWKASLMPDPEKLFAERGEREGMGHFGKISSLNDLPSDTVLKSYIHEAMKLNDGGVKVKKAPVKAKAELVVPDYFKAAISQNNKALETFENFSPSCRREYVDWVTEAKTETTRQSRLATAVEWMSEGKDRMWKYKKK
jgi:uncharacterized protein YdeI (YjbR/CyaY-like superfamily)